MNTYQDHLIDKLTKEINEKIELVVEEAYNKMNPSIPFKEAISCRFPLIRREIFGNEETYWYNNGTVDGIKLVTFLRSPVEFNFNFEDGFENKKIMYNLTIKTYNEEKH